MKKIFFIILVLCLTNLVFASSSTKVEFFDTDYVTPSGDTGGWRLVGDSNPLPVELKNGSSISVSVGSVDVSGIPTYITSGDNANTATVNPSGSILVYDTQLTLANIILANIDNQLFTGTSGVAVNDVYSTHNDTELTITTTESAVNLLSSYNDIIITSDTDVLIGTVSSGSYGTVCWEKSYVPLKDVQTIYIKKKLTGGSATVYIHSEKK